MFFELLGFFLINLGEPNESVSPITGSLHTGYFVGLGSVSISDAPDGAVKVVHDSNTCELNSFGEPTVCTLIAPRVCTTAVELLDTKHKGHVELFGFNNCPEFRLMRHHNHYQLLHLNKTESISAVYPLRSRVTVSALDVTP